MTTVTKLLRRALERQEMSQSDLARAMGLEPQHINNWKVRDSIPKKHVTKLAEILDVPESALIDPASAENASFSRLSPIEWASKDELDQEEFVFAPMLEVELSAGRGRVMDQETEIYQLPIRRYTLTKAGISAADVRMVRVHGDSMADRIPDDSVVAIDTTDIYPRDGKVYAYTDEDLLKVKYLHPLPGGGLRVRSHNPDYPDETLSREEVETRITIHGRVFMSSSML